MRYGDYGYDQTSVDSQYDQIRDVFVYDSEGRLVENARLFDQNGNPIRLGYPDCGGRTTSTATRCCGRTRTARSRRRSGPGPRARPLPPAPPATTPDPSSTPDPSGTPGPTGTPTATGTPTGQPTAGST